MTKVRYLAVILALACGVLSARAGTVEARLLWRDGEPVVELLVAATAPAGLGAVKIPLTLYDAQDEKLWQTEATVPIGIAIPWRAEIALEKVGALKRQHRVELSLRHAGLEIDYREQLYFSGPKGSMLSHGFRSQGVFPQQKVYFVLGLKEFRGRDVRDMPVSLVAYDSDSNTILETQRQVRPERQASFHNLDITPVGGLKTVGPYRVEVEIESDAYGLFFNTSHRFAFANALVPVSSLESGDRKFWFPASPDPRTYTTGRMYYSPHLTPLEPATKPEISFDETEKHGGRRSLRLPYNFGSSAHAWSRQKLPGRPTVLSFWVRGNGSTDMLEVHFEDFINHALQAWHRNANFSHVKVCRLNFAGWRQFRVPVLGDGLQQIGMKGSTPEIDAPIGILAFSVRHWKPPRLRRGQKPSPDTPRPLREIGKGEPLAVWIDDIAVETQVTSEELLSLEIMSNNPDGELTAAGKLVVTVGNGFPTVLEKGRLSLAARDGRGEVVYSSSVELAAPAEDFAMAELPLAQLAAKRPRGPVDIDVTFVDPTRAGARVTRRITLKSALHRGIFADFEKQATYSGFTPGKVTPSKASLAAGGANGSKQALELLVEPMPETPPPPRRGRPLPTPARANNSVLLHPALPGQVDHIELMVQGGERPVDLQVWFVDSAYTGNNYRRYNMFWPKPIRVDWQGWQRVSVKAPPVPSYYGDKNRYFLFEPWYPLNLAFNATLLEGEKQPTKIRLDDIRVVTHLPPAEELQLELDFAGETRVFSPGSPLRVRLRNYAPTKRNLELKYRLTSYQGFVASEGAVPVELAPGAQQYAMLTPKLAPGIYDLELTGYGEEPLRHAVAVLDASEYFGADPLATIADSVALRRMLGLDVERTYLDWDNSEPVPNMFHYQWFANDVEKKSGNGAFKVVPVVGFCADWAGPEAREPLERGTYSRFIPNLYQSPRLLTDWSRFVRECMRENKGRFDEWMFWENPDLEDAPQGLKPTQYGQLLKVFQHWVKLYNPKAKVTIGGFNFHRVLPYLDRMTAPAEMPFDEIAVRMSIAELSPEAADIEGVYDELNRLLEIKKRKRDIQTSELDWSIGPHVSPSQQAAYHARAAMILDSRGAKRHHFSLINGGVSFPGFGVFYRVPYGNPPELQAHKPFHVPKPSFFALIKTRKFLEEFDFIADIGLADRNLGNNRAYLYRNAAGALVAAVWRTIDGERTYRLPAAWRGAKVTDVFGFPVALEAGLRCTPLPFFLRLPAGVKPEEAVHQLRMMAATDGSYPVIMDLHLAEPDSRRRAQYKSTGKARQEHHTGVIPGGRKSSENYVYGLETESFSFKLEAAGNVLLRRHWYFNAGQKLAVSLNDGAAAAWDLSEGQGNDPGVREATFVLRGCLAGENRLSLTYDKPGNAAGYRLEPLPHDYVPLVRWGVLNSRQTKGEIVRYASAVGSPLRIGKQPFASGVGAHAVSFIEYPLDGQFKAFEVTVGIDGHTEGRGSVLFRIYIDDRERASSGTVNGFTKPTKLRIDDLGGARRMVLSVMDAGDGNRHDLADWVDGKLFLK